MRDIKRQAGESLNREVRKRAAALDRLPIEHVGDDICVDVAKGNRRRPRNSPLGRPDSDKPLPQVSGERPKVHHPMDGRAYGVNEQWANYVSRCLRVGAGQAYEAPLRRVLGFE